MSETRTSEKLTQSQDFVKICSRNIKVFVNEGTNRERVGARTLLLLVQSHFAAIDEFIGKLDLRFLARSSDLIGEY